MEILKSDPNKRFELDVKRLYLPLILAGDCPHCKQPWAMNLEKDPNYLSYPDLTEPFDLHCYHDDCDGEWTVKAKLEINLTIVEQK